MRNSFSIKENKTNKGTSHKKRAIREKLKYPRYLKYYSRCAKIQKERWKIKLRKSPRKKEQKEMVKNILMTELIQDIQQLSKMTSREGEHRISKEWK